MRGVGRKRNRIWVCCGGTYVFVFHSAENENRVLALHGEVMACGYEDVRVMWSILDKSKANACNLTDWLLQPREPLLLPGLGSCRVCPCVLLMSSMYSWNVYMWSSVTSSIACMGERWNWTERRKGRDWKIGIKKKGGSGLEGENVLSRTVSEMQMFTLVYFSDNGFSEVR